MSEDRSQWYAEWFNEDYLQVYSHRNDDLAAQEIEFAVKTLRLDPRLPVLDLGCGGGRHVKQLKLQGLDSAYGVDLSASLLTVAAAEPEAAGRLVRADMRLLPFRCCFQAVLSFFTSFGYFGTEEENLRVLKEIRRLLLPNGRLLLDLPSFGVTQTLVPRSEKVVGDLRVVEERQFIATTQRLEKQISIEGPKGIQQFIESVRVYSFREMKQILAQAGLSMIGVWGDFHGNSFSHDSSRMILVAMRDDAPTVLTA